MPGKEAGLSASALQGMLGGAQRGEALSPLCIPFVAKILNSLLPISQQATADSAMALLPLQRTLAHVGPLQVKPQVGCGGAQLQLSLGPQLSPIPAS